MVKERCRVIREKIDKNLIENSIVWVDEDMAQHLRICDECRRYVDITRKIARVLSKIDMPEPSPEFMSNLEDRVMNMVKGIEYVQLEEDKVLKVVKPRKSLGDRLKEFFTKHPKLRTRLGYGLAILALVAVSLYYLIKEFNLFGIYGKEKEYVMEEEPTEEMITPPIEGDEDILVEEEEERISEKDLGIDEKGKLAALDEESAEIGYDGVSPDVDKSTYRYGEGESSEIVSEREEEPPVVSGGVSGDESTYMVMVDVERSAEEDDGSDEMVREFSEDETSVEESGVSGEEVLAMKEMKPGDDSVKTEEIAGATEGELEVESVVVDELTVYEKDDGEKKVVRMPEMTIYAVYDPVNPPDPIEMATEEEIVYEHYREVMDHSELEIEDALLSDTENYSEEEIYKVLSTFEDEEIDEFIKRAEDVEPSDIVES